MSGYDPHFGEQKYEGDLYSDAHRHFNNATAPRKAKKADLAKTNLHPEQRGMGETGLTKRYLTDAEKMAMCHLRGKGLTNVEIAEKLKRSENVVCAVFRQIERAVAAAGLNYDWKEEVRREAVAALRYGLKEEEDPAKRGTLGLNTLKATGDLLSEGALDLARLVNGIPQGHESRYILITPEKPPELEESTDDQPPVA